MDSSQGQSKRHQTAHLLQEFRTIQRALTCVHPDWIEGAWASERAFERLPREVLLSQGIKWFRYRQDDDTFYSEYDPAIGSGRYHQDLPSSVDQALVIDIESSIGRALLDRLAAIVTEVRALGADVAGVETLLRNVTQLYKPGVVRERLLEVMRYDYYEAFVSQDNGTPEGPDRLLAWLDENTARAESLHVEAKIDGKDMAAILLIREVARHLIDAVRQQPIGVQLALYDRYLLSPLTRSFPGTLGALAAGMMLNAGSLARSLFGALESLKQKGEVLIENALNESVPLKLDLPSGELFYEGLWLAEPPLYAAHVGFTCFSKDLFSGKLSKEQQAALPYEANNVEEKVVRVINSMKFAIDNIDRRRFYMDVKSLITLMAQGRPAEFEARLLDLIDNQYFYPRSFRENFRQ